MWATCGNTAMTNEVGQKSIHLNSDLHWTGLSCFFHKKVLVLACASAVAMGHCFLATHLWPTVGSVMENKKIKRRRKNTCICMSIFHTHMITLNEKRRIAHFAIKKTQTSSQHNDSQISVELSILFEKIAPLHIIFPNAAGLQHQIKVSLSFFLWHEGK